jgi:hypothetical protein
MDNASASKEIQKFWLNLWKKKKPDNNILTPTLSQNVCAVCSAPLLV